MKKNLKDIALVQSGIYSPAFSIGGEVMYLQAKYFDEHGQFCASFSPDLPLNSQTEKHLLKESDVLFAAKGLKNFATLYESKNGYGVASSTFLVVRIMPHLRASLLPAYLVWFMNLPPTQTWLKNKAMGTALPSISKAVLRELEIPFPSIEKQEAILKIQALHQQELSLQKQMTILKEKYIQQSLIQAIGQ